MESQKNGKECLRIWRKLHLVVDSRTHEIICADLSLNNVADSEAFPFFIRQTHRKITSAITDDTYNYTASADSRNAENSIVLRGVPQIAAQYEKEFNRLWAESEVLAPAY